MSLKVPVGAVIEGARFSRYQQRIIAVCLTIGLAEGINALSIGYVLPSLAVQYNVSPAAFSLIFVTALLGEILGNFVLAPLGDKYGRRTMLRVGISIFALAAVPSAMVGSVEALAVCRFFAGLGIGAAVPSMFTLAGDYTPNSVKGRVISVVSMSISAGGFLIGLVAANFIPAFGGPAFLLLGGLIPIILLFLTWFALPESVEFLAERKDQDSVRRILHRIAPGVVPVEADATTPIYVPAEQVKGARVAQLFRNGRGLPTVMLWMMSFVGLFNAYFIFAFLATILVVDGVAEETALLSVSLATFGGMAGGVLLGFLMDRTPLGPAAGTLGAAIAIAGFIFLAIVDPTTNEFTFLVLGAALGLGAIGANSCAQVLATQVYPPIIRATGLGWYSAVGRLGALLAPVVIGGLLGANVAPGNLYIYATIPLAILGALLLVFMVRYGSNLRKRGTESDLAHEVLSADMVLPAAEGRS